jgi:hypothetical protein
MVSVNSAAPRNRSDPDLREHQGYLEREAATMAITEIAGARTFLAVPMLKENTQTAGLSIGIVVRPSTQSNTGSDT